jgi:hypothetical protein
MPRRIQHQDMAQLRELSSLSIVGSRYFYGDYQVLLSLSGSATGSYHSCASVYIRLPRRGVVYPATMAIMSMYISIDNPSVC